MLNSAQIIRMPTGEKLFQGLNLFVLWSASHRGGFQVDLGVGEHLWIRIVLMCKKKIWVIKGENHFEATSGLRLPRLDSTAELIRELMDKSLSSEFLGVETCCPLVKASRRLKKMTERASWGFDEA